MPSAIKAWSRPRTAANGTSRGASSTRRPQHCLAKPSNRIAEDVCGKVACGRRDIYLNFAIGFGVQNSGSAAIQSFAGIPQYGRTARMVVVSELASAAKLSAS
jgi:hypothetical protein